MNRRNAPPPSASDDDFAWLREGSLPYSREDRIAEALALLALLFSLCAGLVIALLPVSARAAEAAAPSLELLAWRVVPATPGHPEQLVAAAQARAGDQLEYQAVYRNAGAATAHHVMVTVPVPGNGVEYLLDTAAPHADAASTDGRQFSPVPLLRVEKALDGRTLTRPAPGADYRFLRWNLGDVPAGASRTVRTRVQLLSTAVAAR